jgi:hypothetical protein
MKFTYLMAAKIIHHSLAERQHAPSTAVCVQEQFIGLHCDM